MKPKSFEKNFSNDVDATLKGTFPLTDYHYHSVALPNFRGGCARPKLHSFRNISSEYFRTEARGEFRTEVIAFAAIFVTAAIPVLSSVRALADFLHAIGTL
jgi:hypothetical protein